MKRKREKPKSFSPPESVRAAARKGLLLRASKPPSQRGTTPVGIARARDLANGRKVSLSTIKRMKAYFDRHQVDKKGSTWSKGGKGKQSWLNWGGDPGYRWSKQILRKYDD